MKKLILLLLLLLLCSSFLMADGLTVDISAGIYYNAHDFETEGAFQFLESLFYLRAGGLLGAGYRVNKFLSAGGELGFLYMTYDFGDGENALIDVPMHLYADMSLGNILAFRPYGGAVMLHSTAESAVYHFNPELGACLSLGGFYFEAAYVFADESYTRYGIGFTGYLID